MPKIIITEDTLPVCLHTLDMWKGKLTWDLYTERLVTRLDEKSIAPVTLKCHRQISEAFRQAKKRLNAEKNDDISQHGATAEVLQKENQTLKAQLERAQKDIEALQLTFSTLIHNINMIDNLDMEAVRKALQTPLRDMSGKGTIHG